EELPRQGEVLPRLTAGRAMPRRLRDLGEHAWIAGLVRRLGGRSAGGRLVLGPGDDAAVLRAGRRPLLLTVDPRVEGRLFRLGGEAPAALGRRVLRTNLSDVAAMGGVPVAALVAMQAPPRLPVAVLDGIMRGLLSDARRHRVAIAGGNLVAGPQLA